MRRKSVYLLLALLGCVVLYAQDDHLEPEFGDEYGYAHYDSLVGNRFGDCSELRFIEAPSSFYLSAFSLEKEKGEYYLKTNTIHHAGTSSRKPGFHTLKVSSMFAQSLKNLFREAVGQVDFPGEDTRGLDGCTFFYSIRQENGCIKTGRKWSPADSTGMGELAGLCTRITKAETTTHLPAVAELKQLTDAIKRYGEAYRHYHKRYKSRGLFDLTGDYYKNAHPDIDAPPYLVYGDFTDYAFWRMEYPDSLLQTDTWGEAICYLFIDSAGYISGKQIYATHPLFEKEAARLLEETRRWEAAKKNGVPVACDVVVYIPFNPEAYRHRFAWQEQKLEACPGQTVDSEPVFPDSIRRIVMGNMRWPSEALTDTATVVCRFTVAPSGYVENAQVVSGTDPAFKAMALSIIYGFPPLIPALKDNQYVPFDYQLTLHFWGSDFRQFFKEVSKREEGVFGGYTEIYPSFPGGDQKLMEFINNRLRITQEMKNNAIQGRVICSFTINRDGSLSDFEVIRGLHPLLDAEALRIVKSMPRWNSGTYVGGKGYRVFCRVKYTVPVIFKW